MFAQREFYCNNQVYLSETLTLDSRVHWILFRLDTIQCYHASENEIRLVSLCAITTIS